MDRPELVSKMLCLSRKINERVIVGNNLGVVTVLAVQGDKVKLGFDFPREVPVHREEIQQLIDRDGPKKAE